MREPMIRRGDALGRLLLPVPQRGAVVHTRSLRGGPQGGHPEAPAGLTEHAVYKCLRTRALEQFTSGRSEVERTPRRN